MSIPRMPSSEDIYGLNDNYSEYREVYTRPTHYNPSKLSSIALKAMEMHPQRPYYFKYGRDFVVALAQNRLNPNQKLQACQWSQKKRQTLTKPLNSILRKEGFVGEIREVPSSARGLCVGGSLHFVQELEKNPQQVTTLAQKVEEGVSFDAFVTQVQYNGLFYHLKHKRKNVDAYSCNLVLEQMGWQRKPWKQITSHQELKSEISHSKKGSFAIHLRFPDSRPESKGVLTGHALTINKRGPNSYIVYDSNHFTAYSTDGPELVSQHIQTKYNLWDSNLKNMQKKNPNAGFWIRKY